MHKQIYGSGCLSALSRRGVAPLRHRVYSTPAALQSGSLAHVTNYLSLHTCHTCTVPPIHPSIHSAQKSTQQAETLYPIYLINLI